MKKFSMFNAVVLVVVLVLVLLMGAREGWTNTVNGYPKNLGSGSSTWETPGNIYDTDDKCADIFVNDKDRYKSWTRRTSTHPGYWKNSKWLGALKKVHVNQANTCYGHIYTSNPITTLADTTNHVTGCTDSTKKFPNCL